MSPTNSLPASGSHFISLSRGIEMTALYRSQREAILATQYQGMQILPICETFNRDDIDILLEKEGCAALRVYFGMDESYKVKVLIVAVNQDAEDILPSPQSLNSLENEEDIVEEGHRCPDSCPPESPLNS